MLSTNAIGYFAVALTFLSVVLVVYAFGKGASNRQVKKRLGQVVGPRRSLKTKADLSFSSDRLTDFFEALSRLSVPADGWQSSEIRLRFIRAGFRGNDAAKIYFAIKSLMSIVAPLALGLTLIIFNPGMGLQKTAFFVLAVAAAGYYLPDFYLKMRTAGRSKQMRETLPDLLDLLVICIESGLGLDSALNRVSREIARSSPVLAEEFYLASLEIRAGSGRIPALKNLSLRINLEDMYNLISMLVQADKFGTSLGASLRIQSEVMRVKRMQRAEEIAAKIPVKMLFPLILFIFPSLMAVILGPAFIQIATTFGK